MREMSSAGSRILTESAAAIEAVDCGRCSLDEYLDTQLTAREYRRTISDLLLNFYRRRKAIETALRKHIRKAPAPSLASLLYAVLTQLSCQTGIAPESAVNIAVDTAKQRIDRYAANFVNALLRKILREGGVSFSDTPEAVLPEPLLKRWEMRFSAAELSELTRLFLTPAKFTFRAERDFQPDFSGLEILDAFGAFRFFAAADPAEVLNSTALRNGKLYVQDPATSLAPSLAEYPAKAKVLDLCAAPGGKSLMLAEKLPAAGMLTAADRSDRRQQLTRQNFALRGLKFPVITAEPADLCGTFDVVLADVPCSNTGVFRRRPDALWRFSGSALARIMQLQRIILAEAARLTAPGGELIYSTCSIEPEEDSKQIEYFQKQHPEFTLETEKLLLPAENHDGAFSAKLRKS